MQNNKTRLLFIVCFSALFHEAFRTEYGGGVEHLGRYTYPVLQNNETIDFKYFQRIQNDNSAFFDKFRKNWLHILTDDVGENYNRTSVYPTISAEMSDKTDEIMQSFRENRRGIIR